MVAIGCHPAYPLICAHNRDENRDRPSSGERLEPETGLVCGRDLRAGGCVMGLDSSSGRFAALTNVRTRHKRDPATVTSRGRLVEHLVCGRSPPLSEYIDEHLLDPFHVVCGDAFAEDPCVQYARCCPEEDEAGSVVRFETSAVQEVGQGVFVVSNEDRAAGSGTWPKCNWLQEQVAGFMAALPVAPPPPVEAVHAGIAEIMGRFGVPEIGPPARLPDHFAPQQEGLLHTGPFCPWRAGFPHFGTVSQRVLIRDSGAVRYYHRSTNVGAAEACAPPRCGPWECITIPVLPSEPAGAERAKSSRGEREGTLDGARPAGPEAKRARL